jgi:NADH pyrophosphatase NudC (nudix superfamily)
MNAMPLETALLLASTTGVGYLMLSAGIEKKALEWRRRRRFCPGCGKPITGRVCSCSS